MGTSARYPNARTVEEHPDLCSSLNFQPMVVSSKKGTRALKVGRMTSWTIWGWKPRILKVDHQLIHWIPLKGTRLSLKYTRLQLTGPPLRTDEAKWRCGPTPLS